MHYISCKHRVLIIDYRNDQTDVIQYANAGQLLIAQVPADAIVPGLVPWDYFCITLMKLNIKFTSSFQDCLIGDYILEGNKLKFVSVRIINVSETVRWE